MPQNNNDERSLCRTAQDLQRFAEGPARYIHDIPNKGIKATLAREIISSPRGRVPQGVFSGPAQHTQIVMDRRQYCKRTYAGPDPYFVLTSAGSVVTPRPHSSGRFATENSQRRAPHVLGRTAVQAFDPYHVSSRSVANSWRHESNSIKSLLGKPMPQSPRNSPFILNASSTPQSARGFRPTYNRMAPAKLELIPVMRSARFGGGYPFA